MNIFYICNNNSNNNFYDLIMCVEQIILFRTLSSHAQLSFNVYCLKKKPKGEKLPDECIALICQPM